MRAYEFVKHQNCLDVVFEVKKVQWKGPDYWKIRGYWYTDAYGGKLKKLFSEPETIKVKKKDLRYWKAVAYTGFIETR